MIDRIDTDAEASSVSSPTDPPCFFIIIFTHFLHMADPTFSHESPRAFICVALGRRGRGAHAAAQVSAGHTRESRAHYEGVHHALPLHRSVWVVVEMTGQGVGCGVGGGGEASEYEMGEFSDGDLVRI